MKLLREYIRALLTEAAMGPTDLPDGVGIAYRQQNQSISVMYYHIGEKTPLSGGWKGSRALAQRGLPIGEVTIGRQLLPDYRGECSGAFEVHGSSATHGWGPMLYDVAMELATIHGGGLMSDRDSVSAEARSVWDYYMHNRTAATGIQMDDLKNTLTPEEEDNCNQQSASFNDWAIDPGDMETDWEESPLSKRWTKPPTTMDALRAAGKLVEL